MKQNTAKKGLSPLKIALLALVALAAAGIVFLTFVGNAKPAEAPEAEAAAPVTAVIEIKDYGTVKVELDPVNAPISVENFVKLAKEGFYDGLTFHRIISGFMIQGGCPEGTGFGGSGTEIKGEFSANGVDNTISHVRGVISMARSQSYDSASSQFFIVHQDSTFLDGQYAGFGHVTEGMEVVDAICSSVPQGENGAVAAADQPVITSVTIVEE
ncbi:MAG: peptidylprolyl isomerase [Clostridia bacterium]|nr:peptidylprolyl isomerase [Clostridia bacterium]